MGGHGRATAMPLRRGAVRSGTGLRGHRDDTPRLVFIYGDVAISAPASVLKKRTPRACNRARDTPCMCMLGAGAPDSCLRRNRKVHRLAIAAQRVIFAVRRLLFWKALHPRVGDHEEGHDYILEAVSDENWHTRAPQYVVFQLAWILVLWFQFL